MGPARATRPPIPRSPVVSIWTSATSPSAKILRGKPLGTPCDVADPNDCHLSFCDGGETDGTCRSHHEENEGFECLYGHGDCHYGLCASGGGCNGDYLRATDYPCTDEGNACTIDACVNTVSASTCYHYGDPSLIGVACAPDSNSCTDEVCNGTGTCTHPILPAGTTCAADNNVCTLDVCDSSGTCTHTADPAAQGQPCVNTSGCINTAVCSGSSCVVATCKTTGYCDGCSSRPACVDNLGTNCGCQ